MSPQEIGVLEQAAAVWESLGLPNFAVEGHLDGKPKNYTVPEVLRIAAERMRTQAALTEAPQAS